MSVNDDDDDDNDVDCDGNAIERASEIDLINIVALALAHMNYLNELRKLSCSMKRHS